MVNIL